MQTILFVQPLNQVIIWDKIVTSKDTAWLQEKNEFVKYALIDQGHELRYAKMIIEQFFHTYFPDVLRECLRILLSATIIDRNKTVSLRLMWDHMPVTGRLYNGDERKNSFTLPSKYKN